MPVPGGPLTVNVVTVNDGAGSQTDPHLSGDWVSYTDNSVYGIRFQNLDLGPASDRLIPTAEGKFDALSEIGGNTIVFARAGASGANEAELREKLGLDPLDHESRLQLADVLAGKRRYREAMDELLARLSRAADLRGEVPVARAAEDHDALRAVGHDADGVVRQLAGGHEQDRRVQRPGHGRGRERVGEAVDARLIDRQPAVLPPP